MSSDVEHLTVKFAYPEDKLTTIVLKHSEYTSEEQMHETNIKNFIDSDCDYYMFIDRDHILKNASTLKELVSLNKDVVAPMLRRGEDLWTNFWGDIDDKGYYRRSFDYIDIVNNKRRGCWNVPYITGTYLVKKQVLVDNKNLFTETDSIDIDMRFCYNLRKCGVFMYVSNISTYGYIIDQKKIESVSKAPDQITLFDLFTNRGSWEAKYLHPEYLQNKTTFEKLNIVEVCDTIYTFPLFSEVFCSELIAIMEKYGKWSGGKDNHMDSRLGKKLL